MSLTFTASKPLTLGVEIELQLLDTSTWDLTSRVEELIDLLPPEMENVKHEIFQNMIEVNTGICNDAHEVTNDLMRTLRMLHAIAEPRGIALAAVGTHPFARYRDSKLVDKQRYHSLIDRHQWVARRLGIFGLHVHVGMTSGDHCIAMTNRMLRYAHLLLAMSASSPYWQGQDTGLASARSTIFESSPTAGHPCLVRNWAEFADLVARLKRSDGIRTMKDLWWDIRPSPSYGTMEIRIADSLATVSETSALVAFIHALLIHLDDEAIPGRTPEPPPMWLIRENKWRAARHGLDANVIVDDAGHTLPVRKQIENIMERLSPIAKQLGYESHFATLVDMMDYGGSYERQRRAFAETGSLAEVAQMSSSELTSELIEVGGIGYAAA